MKKTFITYSMTSGLMLLVSEDYETANNAATKEKKGICNVQTVFLSEEVEEAIKSAQKAKSKVFIQDSEAITEKGLILIRDGAMVFVKPTEEA